MLLAARDKLGDHIDEKETLIGDGNEKGEEVSIVALYEKPIFHQGGQIEDDGLNTENVHGD